MVLNNLPQMFTIYFPSNFWYKEVYDTWNPIINKMRLPYQDVNDFMNQQIQQVTFPGVSIDMATQQRMQYEYGYAPGKELEALMTKTINITFKLTESYLSYWIVWDQVDRFLHYRFPGADPKFEHGEREVKPILMEPINIGFLNDSGLQMFDFTFYDILPTQVAELNLSYAATVASYNTFSWTLHFNRYEIK